MVLSGDGGDECFAGYEDTYGPWMQHLAARERKPSLPAWLQFVDYTSYEWRQALWRAEFRNDVCTESLPSFAREYRRAKRFSICSQVQYLDLKTYLPYDILTKVDIASMMHGLEVRTPFVDINVVSFAATIPESYNVSFHEGAKWAGKMMLKRNASKWYASDFLHRPKQGFGLPTSRWFGESGVLSAALAERLHDTSSPLWDYFRLAAVNELIVSASEDTKWLLLFLDEWLRHERSLCFR
jgi:asparagine synthase (glutamine-hydrolysing)